MDAQDQAAADQIHAAVTERMAAKHDIAHWLQPEGVQRQVSVRADARVVGPITDAFMAWLAEAPHAPGCEVAASGPRPLFAFVTDPKVYCAACFDTIVRAYASSQAELDLPFCSICMTECSAVSPTTMQLGTFTVYALVCADCQRKEHKASLEERYYRVAGVLPRHMRDADPKPDHR